MNMARQLGGMALIFHAARTRAACSSACALAHAAARLLGNRR